MAKLTYSLLDQSDPDAVAQYERCLFRAFYPPREPLFERVREVDTTGKRMRILIPYADQDVFVARLDDRIIAGAAVNYNSNALLQLEMLGFSVDKSRRNYCEGLVIFNTQALLGNHPVMIELGDFMHAELLKKKIVYTYGTCIERLLRGYQVLGFKAIDHRDLIATRIYLLEKKIDTQLLGFHKVTG